MKGRDERPKRVRFAYEARRDEGTKGRRAGTRRHQPESAGVGADGGRWEGGGGGGFWAAARRDLAKARRAWESSRAFLSLRRRSASSRWVAARSAARRAEASCQRVEAMRCCIMRMPRRRLKAASVMA